MILSSSSRPLRVIAIVGWIAACASSDPADERLIDTERSSVTVRVFTSDAVTSDVTIDAPLSEGSIDGSATPHVQLVIDARRLRVSDSRLSTKDRQEVETRMLGPDVLDTNRFQRISFHSLESEPLDTGGWLVRGELELRGRIQPVTATAFAENGRYKGSATVRQSDFGMAPIHIARGALKVRDEIKVDFDIATIDP